MYIGKAIIGLFLHCLGYKQNLFSQNLCLYNNLPDCISVVSVVLGLFDPKLQGLGIFGLHPILGSGRSLVTEVLDDGVTFNATLH